MSDIYYEDETFSFLTLKYVAVECECQEMWQMFGLIFFMFKAKILLNRNMS
jgi:hypothetical protein